MPCQSDYLEHTDREAESGRVLEFLKEVAGQPFDHENPDYYGKPENLDADTAKLCDWCKAHTEQVPRMSLELQLWWQRHQKSDARREAEERRRVEKRRIAEQGRAKLTAAELKALGLKE